MVHPRLVLSPTWKWVCTVLQIVPLPGVGAIIAGIKNPHSGLTKRGIAQLALVVFGSWPLILPGAAGLIWAIVDAVRIARWSQNTPPWSFPTRDADPETLSPTAAQRRAARQARREDKRRAAVKRRDERAEAKQAKRDSQ